MNRIILNSVSDEGVGIVFVWPYVSLNVNLSPPAYCLLFLTYRHQFVSVCNNCWVGGRGAEHTSPPSIKQ